MIDELKKLLRRHEGENLFPYPDPLHPEIITIGVGRNLSAKGISKGEMLFMLDNDIDDAITDAQSIFPHFWSYSDNRQMVILSMLFNLGKAGFLEFKKMKKAIEEEKWLIASVEMLDSVWARQIGIRAFELAGMMERG